MLPDAVILAAARVGGIVANNELAPLGQELDEGYRIWTGKSWNALGGL